MGFRERFERGTSGAVEPARSGGGATGNVGADDPACRHMHDLVGEGRQGWVYLRIRKGGGWGIWVMLSDGDVGASDSGRTHVQDLGESMRGACDKGNE